MNVVKIILKVLLTIIRIPFTIWYIVVGLPWKVFSFIVNILGKIASVMGVKFDSMPDGIGFLVAIITFEWASLVKFYHFHW